MDRFWHNKAIPDLIFSLSFCILPLCRVLGILSCYLNPSDCESECVWVDKVFRVECPRCHTAAALLFSRYGSVQTYATYQCTLLLSVPCRSTIMNLSSELSKENVKLHSFWDFFSLRQLHMLHLYCVITSRIGVDLSLLLELYTIDCNFFSAVFQ